jgi:(+)-neomenthol dehydrogenase
LHVCVQQLSGMDMDQRLQCMFKRVRETYDAATEGIKTNYYGIKHVIEALLPLLQASSDGRIVNVSSDFGLLRVTTNQYIYINSIFQQQRQTF